MPKIQLALDTLSAETALELAGLTCTYVDIIEAGTPLIKSVGIGIVSRLKVAFPDKLILADLKSSDVGAYEANMAFAAGADIVTTQGITTLATIAEVQQEANKWKRRAEVDMTGVADPVKRTMEVKTLGVSLVLYHRSIDQEMTEGAQWDETACDTVRAMCAQGVDVAVAGGLKLDLLPRLAGLPIYGMVIGRGITAHREPLSAVQAIFLKRRELWPA